METKRPGEEVFLRGVCQCLSSKFLTPHRVVGRRDRAEKPSRGKPGIRPIGRRSITRYLKQLS